MNESPQPLRIRIAPAGRGADWLVDGFTFFSKNWLAWTGVVIFILVLKIATLFIPVVGRMAMQILMPVFTGGLMLGCRSQDRGEGFSFEHLFAGFSNRFMQLAALGVVQLAGTFLILVACSVILFFLAGGMDTMMNMYHSIQHAVTQNDVNRILQAASGMSLMLLVAVLIGLSLYLPLLILVWFAPALVILDGMDVISAMKYSFIGCVKNFVPYLVYGVVGLVFSIVASIPLLLGWLVLIPVMIISIYLAYKDIYPQASN